MFTGIIETVGVIKDLESRGTNRSFWIESSISPELKIDQSVSHNGVCLTIEEIKGSTHRVTAIEETIEKTNLANWKINSRVNLERSLLLNARLDGHLVQGHVDGIAKCISKDTKEGSVEFQFNFDEKFAALIIEKGSVCLNGISLTAFKVSRNEFRVAIIPFTLAHTNLDVLNVGDTVNVEFDVFGKYLQRKISLNEEF